MVFVQGKAMKAEHTWRMWAFQRPKACAKRTHQNDFSKKNEVFGGSSTHKRAPLAVLAAQCCNLPISSTERKPRAKSTKNIWNSEGENELPTLQSNSFELKSRQIIICCTAMANVLRQFCRGAAEEGETFSPTETRSTVHTRAKKMRSSEVIRLTREHLPQS